MHIFLELLICLFSVFVSGIVGWLLGKVLNDLDTVENDSRYQSYFASCGVAACTTALAVWLYGPIGWCSLLALPAIFPVSRYMFYVCTPVDSFESHFAEGADTDLQWMCAICGGLGSAILSLSLMCAWGWTGAMAALAVSWLVPLVAGGAVLFALCTVVSIFSQGLPWLGDKVSALGGNIAKAIRLRSGK